MGKTRKLLALAAPAAMLALPVAFAAPAAASTQADSATYQANLEPLNDSGASGSYMVKINGSEVTVTGHISGLATTFKDSPYPHVQHIHINGQGQCPTPSADTDGNGIVDTVEGQPAYGKIGTTLSVKGDTSASAGTNIKIAPSGGSYDYSRTFTLNDKTLQSVKAGTGVVVVHGLDASKNPKGAKSNLVPSLPLAATAPAACGALNVSQMSQVPSGAANTGGGSTSGIEDARLFGVGGAALLAAGGTVMLRRKRTSGQR